MGIELGKQEARLGIPMGAFNPAAGGSVDIKPATEDTQGIIAIATEELAKEGVNDETAITPLKLAKVLDEKIIDAYTKDEVDTKISGVEADIAGVETTVQGLGTTVEGLTTNVESMQSDIDTITTQVEDVTSSVTDLATAVQGKQETLVSGTNIKTINGETVLGEGDIEIKGGGDPFIAELPLVKTVESKGALVQGLSIEDGLVVGNYHSSIPTSSNTFKFGNGAGIGYGKTSEGDYLNHDSFIEVPLERDTIFYLPFVDGSLTKDKGAAWTVMVGTKDADGNFYPKAVSLWNIFSYVTVNNRDYALLSGDILQGYGDQYGTSTSSAPVTGFKRQAFCVTSDNKLQMLNVFYTGSSRLTTADLRTAQLSDYISDATHLRFVPFESNGIIGTDFITKDTSGTDLQTMLNKGASAYLAAENNAVPIPNEVTTTDKLSLKVDNTTLTVDKTGKLSVIGGGGKEYKAGVGMELKDDTFSIDRVAPQYTELFTRNSNPTIEDGVLSLKYRTWVSKTFPTVIDMSRKWSIDFSYNSKGSSNSADIIRLVDASGQATAKFYPYIYSSGEVSHCWWAQNADGTQGGNGNIPTSTTTRTNVKVYAHIEYTGESTIFRLGTSKGGNDVCDFTLTSYTQMFEPVYGDRPLRNVRSITLGYWSDYGSYTYNVGDMFLREFEFKYHDGEEVYKAYDQIGNAVVTSSTELGLAQVDGTTIVADKNGVISAPYKVDIATTDTVGTVKPDGTTLTIDETGKLSAVKQGTDFETANPIYMDEQREYTHLHGITDEGEAMTADVGYFSDYPTTYYGNFTNGDTIEIGTVGEQTYFEPRSYVEVPLELDTTYLLPGDFTDSTGNGRGLWTPIIGRKDAEGHFFPLMFPAKNSDFSYYYYNIDHCVQNPSDNTARIWGDRYSSSMRYGITYKEGQKSYAFSVSSAGKMQYTSGPNQWEKMLIISETQQSHTAIIGRATHIRFLPYDTTCVLSADSKFGKVVGKNATDLYPEALYAQAIANAEPIADAIVKNVLTLDIDTETLAVTEEGKLSVIGGGGEAVTPDGVTIQLNENNQLKTSVDINALAEKVDDLQLFKFPNAVIIGEPTINNGQVSNFSVDNYMQFPFVFDLHNKPFKARMCFTTDEDVTTQQNILDSNFGMALAIKDGLGLMAISSNGTDWNIGNTQGTFAIQPNTTYYADLSWNGILYKTEISTDGEAYQMDMNLASNLPPFPRTMFIGGCSTAVTGHEPHPFKGTINMNKCSFEISNQLIWQGMDDVGLATRADVSLSNIDDDAKQVIKDIAGSGNPLIAGAPLRKGTLTDAAIQGFDVVNDVYTPQTTLNLAYVSDAYGGYVNSTLTGTDIEVIDGRLAINTKSYIEQPFEYNTMYFIPAANKDKTSSSSFDSGYTIVFGSKDSDGNFFPECIVQAGAEAVYHGFISFTPGTTTTQVVSKRTEINSSYSGRDSIGSSSTYKSIFVCASSSGKIHTQWSNSSTYCYRYDIPKAVTSATHVRFYRTNTAPKYVSEYSMFSTYKNVTDTELSSMGVSGSRTRMQNSVPMDLSATQVFDYMSLDINPNTMEITSDGRLSAKSTSGGGEPGPAGDYEPLTNKPQISNHELVGNLPVAGALYLSNQPDKPCLYNASYNQETQWVTFSKPSGMISHSSTALYLTGGTSAADASTGVNYSSYAEFPYTFDDLVQHGRYNSSGYEQNGVDFGYYNELGNFSPVIHIDYILGSCIILSRYNYYANPRYNAYIFSPTSRTAKTSIQTQSSSYNTISQIAFNTITGNYEYRYLVGSIAWTGIVPSEYSDLVSKITHVRAWTYKTSSTGYTAPNMTFKYLENPDATDIADVTTEQLFTLQIKQMPETTNIATLCCDYPSSDYVTVSNKPRINGVELNGNLNLSNFNGQTLLEPNEGIVMKHNSDWTLLSATYDEANKQVTNSITNATQPNYSSGGSAGYTRLNTYGAYYARDIATYVDAYTCQPKMGIITPFYKNVTWAFAGTFTYETLIIGVWDGTNFKPKFYKSPMAATTGNAYNYGPMIRFSSLYNYGTGNYNIFTNDGSSTTNETRFVNYTPSSTASGYSTPGCYLLIQYDGDKYTIESDTYVYPSSGSSTAAVTRGRRIWTPNAADTATLNECNACWYLPSATSISGAGKNGTKIIPGDVSAHIRDWTANYVDFDSYLPDTNADMYSTTISVKADEESIKFDTNGKLRAATTPSYSTAYLLEQRISEDETDNAIYFTNTGKDALVTFNYTIANPEASSYDYEIYPDVESAPDVFQHYYYHVGFVTLPIRAGATIKITSESFNRVEAESTQYFLVTAIPFV